ncbi:hypothetical protein UFOVP71_154 [uncultured Caudovirales phage]|uniref:Uncharacterized protein n=1 Tax=uncultured Caudovirales phage TaxID=2100421 RepID=A0A6J5T9P0_9CAUD|nr:hypothetical protein UFOVP71_154 [uncultured Caudovirales phage]
MAISNRIPEGRWDTNEQRSHYWMVYKKFHYFHDASGNEYIEIQRQVREAIAEVRSQLEEHQIDIINVATQQFMDTMRDGTCLGVAVAFKSREDLAMAKILVECDSVYGL